MKAVPAGPGGARAIWGGCAALAIWLGFPNDILDLPWAVLFWPAALVLLGRAAATPRSAFLSGWLATAVGMAAALYWLTLPLHNVGGLPWAGSAACALFVVACLATQGGLAALLARLCRASRPLFLAAIFGLAWFLLETAYARVAGFPWLPLAGALAQRPLLVQGADSVGAYGLAGLWVFACVACLPPFRGGKTGGQPRRKLADTGAGLAMLALLLGYGLLRLERVPANPSPEGPDSLALLFVEGNIDQNVKWIPSFQRQTLERYLRLTSEGLAQCPDAKPLIIWPETAMPFFYEENPLLGRFIAEATRAFGCPLLFGAPGVEPISPADSRAGKERPLYNRAFLLSPEGVPLGHYDKEHLVPFGEYVPSWLDVEFLSGLLQGVGTYRPGTATRPLRYGDLALGMLICYEGIFPWLAQARVTDGAAILVDISNDGWFGATPASRQHLYLTALRAVEQNRWLLRGTNTGISCVIDTRGRVVFRGVQFTAEALSARAGIVREASLYHALAPWLAPCALLLLAGLLFARRRQDNNDTTTEYH